MIQTENITKSFGKKKILSGIVVMEIGMLDRLPGWSLQIPEFHPLPHAVQTMRVAATGQPVRFFSCILHLRGVHMAFAWAVFSIRSAQA